MKPAPKAFETPSSDSSRAEGRKTRIGDVSDGEAADSLIPETGGEADAGRIEAEVAEAEATPEASHADTNRADEEDEPKTSDSPPPRPPAKLDACRRSLPRPA